jgi:hypothetical protein
MRVPIDIFTKKVLETLYSPLPLRIEKHDDLHARLLVLAATADTEDVTHLDDILTEHIELNLPPGIAEILRGIPYRTGAKLKKFVRSVFLEYVYARHGLGQQALISIENFCDEHEVELDVDITYDALLQAWKRFFRTKNRECFDRYRRQSVLLSGHSVLKKMRHVTPYSDDALRDIINTYLSENRLLFHHRQDERRPFIKKRRDQLKAYVWRVIGGRPAKTTAHRLKVHERQLRRHVASFKIFLATAPPVVLSKEKTPQ